MNFSQQFNPSKNTGSEKILPILTRARAACGSTKAKYPAVLENKAGMIATCLSPPPWR